MDFSLVIIHKRFGGICCFHLQGLRTSVFWLHADVSKEYAASIFRTGGSMILRNVGIQPTDYTAQQPRIPLSCSRTMKTSNPTSTCIAFVLYPSSIHLHLTFATVCLSSHVHKMTLSFPILLFLFQTPPKGPPPPFLLFETIRKFLHRHMVTSLNRKETTLN
jgi:hypothetical protein